MVNQEQAKNELLEAWEAYDIAAGDEKVRLFFKIADLVIAYERQGSIPIEYASYRICHCSLSDEPLPETLKPLLDEACDLEVGEDLMDPEELRSRWDKLVSDIEKAKNRFSAKLV